MAIAPKIKTHDSFVDLKTGQISREIFVSDETYQQEQERVFTRAWMFVGHESQIRKPGNFYKWCSEFMNADSWEQLATWRGQV